MRALRKHNTRHQARAAWRSRRGTILVAVLWILVVLTTVALTFGSQTRVELLIANAGVRRAVALAAARSGVARALAELAADETVWDGPDEPWRRADDRLHAARVGADEQAGTFSLLRDDHENDTQLAFGLQDEASKLNVNTATRPELVALLVQLSFPDVSVDDVADAILDWRDADDQPRAYGAENEYYLSLERPYYAKNAPFETVEELLMVRGINQRLLTGEDANRNGVLDPNERDGDANPPEDNGDGTLDRGLAAYLTVYSAEPDVAADGRPRLNVNTAAATALRNRLSERIESQLIERIIDHRASGMNNIADLLNVAGMTNDAFKRIVDLLTVAEQPLRIGLVNVNTAPEAVLAALPGIDATAAAALVAHRQSTPELQTIGWLLDVLTPEQFRAVADRVTTRSYQFTIDAVGLPPRGAGFARLQVVVDRSATPARVLYWREISHLGPPAPLNELRGTETGRTLTVAGR